MHQLYLSGARVTQVGGDEDAIPNGKRLDEMIVGAG
jgi:hypothetical protein